MTIDRLKVIREQAAKLKGNSEILTKEVSTEEAPELPVVFANKSFLSITKNKSVNTVTDIIAKFAIQDEVAESIQVTEEQGNRINKSLGRMVTGVAAAVPLICRGDGCSYKESCVTGDTLVLTATGYSRIDSMEKESKILSFNIKTQRIEKDIVKTMKNMGIKPVFRLTTELGNVLNLTEDHRVLTLEGSSLVWKTLEKGLSVGCVLVSEDSGAGVYIQSESIGDCFEDVLKSIEYIGEKEVFDIEVQNNKNFIANNIVIHNCPIFKENVHVLGERCPIEISLIEIWAKEFIEELSIDPNSIVELQVLSRLLEISVLERRLTEYMSIHSPDLTEDFITSVDQEGNVITNKGPSIAFEQREKLDRSKMKLLESLNATRDRKQKIHAQMQQDNKVDTGLQDIRKDLSEVVRNLKKEKEAKIVGGN